MDPSIIKVALKGADQDQSASQGVSGSIGKKTKGKKIFDLMGGAGSFASILRQKGVLFPGESGDETKEGAVGSGTGAINGKHRLEKELTGIKTGRGHLFRKGEKTAGAEAVSPDGKTPFEKDVKLAPEIPISKGTLQAATDGKILSGKLDKNSALKGEGRAAQENIVDLTQGLHGRKGDATQLQSAPEEENKLSLNGSTGKTAGKAKHSSGNAAPLEGKAGSAPGMLSAAGLKENDIAKKKVTGGTVAIVSADGKEDRGLDISKSLNAKAEDAGKVSQELKGHETLSSKNGAGRPEGVTGNDIFNDKAKVTGEAKQDYKNISFEGLQVDKSPDRGVEEIHTVKIDTSSWTSRTDLSGMNGTSNDAGTKINDDTIRPLYFRDVAEQIRDGASNMLKNGSNRIVITLEPPNLGTLNMDIRVQHDMVKMVLIADNQDVKQVLHSNFDQLKTALQDQGLKIDRLEVLVQDKSYDSNAGFQPGGGAMFEEGQGRRDNLKDDNSPLPASPSVRDETDETHTGMISLFA